MLLNCVAGEDSWTSHGCKEIKQWILKEINPEYLLEGLFLELKFQYFGHLMYRADPDAGKDWRQKENGVAEDEMTR